MAGGDHYPPRPPQEDAEKFPPSFSFPSPDGICSTLIGTIEIKLSTDDTSLQAQSNSSSHQPRPSVIFNQSEKDALLKSLQHVLVAKFSHGRPPLEAIRLFFNHLNLKGDIKVSIFDSKHIIVECGHFADFVQIWVKKVWVIKGFTARFFKWDERFHPSFESSTSPIWIHLPCLPLYFYDEKALLKIASVIGRPLFVDKNNINRKKLGYATICVEIDVAKPLIDHILIRFVGDGIIGCSNGFRQDVLYDYIPPFCDFCHHLGHKSEFCKRRMERVQGTQQQGKEKGIGSTSTAPMVLEEVIQYNHGTGSAQAAHKEELLVEDLALEEGEFVETLTCTTGAAGSAEAVGAACDAGTDRIAAGGSTTDVLAVDDAEKAGSKVMGKQALLQLVSEHKEGAGHSNAASNDVEAASMIGNTSEQKLAGDVQEPTPFNILQNSTGEFCVSGQPLVQLEQSVGDVMINSEYIGVQAGSEEKGAEELVVGPLDAKLLESLETPGVSLLMGKQVLLDGVATTTDFCNIPIVENAAGEGCLADGTAVFEGVQEQISSPAVSWAVLVEEDAEPGVESVAGQIVQEREEEQALSALSDVIEEQNDGSNIQPYQTAAEFQNTEITQQAMLETKEPDKDLFTKQFENTNMTVQPALFSAELDVHSNVSKTLNQNLFKALVMTAGNKNEVVQGALEDRSVLSKIKSIKQVDGMLASKYTTPRKLSAAALEFSPNDKDGWGEATICDDKIFLSDEMGDILPAFKCKSVPSSPSKYGSRNHKASTSEYDSKLSVKSKPAKVSKAKAGKDPNKPKRPPTAFFVFMEDFRHEYKAKHPKNKAVSVVGKAGGERWKSLTEEEKAPYIAKAVKRKADYEKSIQAYNKKLAGEAEEESEKSKSEFEDDDDEEGSGEDMILMSKRMMELW